MEEGAKGFFPSLFDMSFTSLITTKIIKLLYVLALIVIGLGYLGWVVVGFSASTGIGVVVLLIIGPLYALVMAIVVRVALEVVIALFRIMESNTEIAANTRR